MAETLSIISIIAFVLSGLCLVCGIFVFFKFKIVSVIGDLSHKKAKKSIAKMRDQNEKSGVKFYGSSNTNLSRGKITDTMTNTGKGNVQTGKKNNVSTANQNPETGLLVDNKAEYKNLQDTAILEDKNETVDINETELLKAENPIADVNNKKVSVRFKVIDDIELIHTDEVIL